LNGEVHAVVNGELYDATSTRQRLAKDAGFSFKGKSDCEIVIALYQLYGVSFLRHLRGEFALCLYDSRYKRFIAARDRYGIKPLFLTELDGSLLVASEAKAFVPLGWNPEWDVKSILERGWTHDQRTLFKGVKKVRATLKIPTVIILRILISIIDPARVLYHLRFIRPYRSAEILGFRVPRKGRYVLGKIITNCAVSDEYHSMSSRNAQRRSSY
jgi:hypothetical protein